MAIDLTDYTEAWRCDETSGTQPLLGVKGEDIPDTNGPDTVTGHVNDPPGTKKARGALDPDLVYFSRAFSAGDIFDIQGQTSCTMTLWFNPDSETPGNAQYPAPFSIHNPADAKGQAMFLAINDGNDSPYFGMRDGITAFNQKLVHANSAKTILWNTWQFLACGYDAARNKIFCAWGRQAGEFYYNEADGFAAGFGYDGTGTTNGFFEFKQALPDNPSKLDHAIWWNGRAVNEEELRFLWNEHSGRSLTDLTASSSASIQQFIYNMRKKKKENNVFNNPKFRQLRYKARYGAKR